MNTSQKAFPKMLKMPGRQSTLWAGAGKHLTTRRMYQRLLTCLDGHSLHPRALQSTLITYLLCRLKFPLLK
jgi:hypothetical protein